MAGILDFLQSPDAQLGIGLLAASGPTTDPNRTGFGQRLQGAMQGMDAQAQQALRMKLMQSQVDENASQAAMRKQQLAMSQRQMDIQNQLLGFGNPTGASPATSAAASGVMPTTPMVSGGATTAPNGSGAPVAGVPSSPQQGTLEAMSKQYGIPAEALKYDLVFNGGKGIAEMVSKRGTPDMQVSNGYAYDKNKIGAGYLPQLNISNTGQASLVQVGPDGLPVVSAPRGAVDTYRSYQGAQADFKPIKIYNPQTGREEYTSEGAVVQPQVNPAGLAPMAGRPGNIQSPGYAGGDRNAANAESIRVMQAELQKPELTDADRAGITREIQRMQMQSGITNAQLAQTGGYAAGPSNNEAAAAAGRQATATSIGSKAGDLLKESSDAANSAVQAVGSAQRMVQALDSNKVLSGPGASLRMKGLQIAETLGIGGKDGPEKIANTRQAIQEMAKLTLEGRKQMSGQGAITNQESALAEKATSGSIDDLTAPEIKQLAQAAERTARWKYTQHETKMQSMSQDPAMAGNVALYKAAPMPDAKASAPVATMRFNPSTGKLEKVQ